MAFAGAYLLAILDGIAAQWHSGTVAVPVDALVLPQPLLYDLDNLSLREELVRPPLHVAFREIDGALQRLLFCQFPLRHLLPLHPARRRPQTHPRVHLARHAFEHPLLIHEAVHQRGEGLSHLRHRLLPPHLDAEKRARSAITAGRKKHLPEARISRQVQLESRQRR